MYLLFTNLFWSSIQWNCLSPRWLGTSFSLGVSGLSFASPYHPCAKTYLLSLVPFQVHLWCLLFLPHPLWKCPPVILLAALQGFPVCLDLRHLPPIHCPLTLCLAHCILHMSSGRGQIRLGLPCLISSPPSGIMFLTSATSNPSRAIIFQLVC